MSEVVSPHSASPCRPAARRSGGRPARPCSGLTARRTSSPTARPSRRRSCGCARRSSGRSSPRSVWSGCECLGLGRRVCRCLLARGDGVCGPSAALSVRVSLAAEPSWRFQQFPWPFLQRTSAQLPGCSSCGAARPRCALVTRGSHRHPSGFGVGVQKLLQRPFGSVRCVHNPVAFAHGNLGVPGRGLCYSLPS